VNLSFQQTCGYSANALFYRPPVITTSSPNVSCISYFEFNTYWSVTKLDLRGHERIFLVRCKHVIRFVWNVIWETMHNVVRLCWFLEVHYCVEIWGLYVGSCRSAIYKQTASKATLQTVQLGVVCREMWSKPFTSLFFVATVLWSAPFTRLFCVLH